MNIRTEICKAVAELLKATANLPDKCEGVDDMVKAVIFDIDAAKIGVDAIRRVVK